MQSRIPGQVRVTMPLTIIQIESGLPPMLISFNDIGYLPVELRGRTPIALRS